VGDRRDVRDRDDDVTLVLGDDWPGAWDLLAFDRPDDWREVAAGLAWDLAGVCAAWVHLEAWHQDPVRMRSLRGRAALVAEVLRTDLPFLLDVGPSAPAGPGQPQLPLLYADEPALERLSERPDDLSWRTYFELPLHLRSELILARARPRLRARWLEDRGAAVDFEVLDPSDDDAFARALRATFEAGAPDADVQRWCAARDEEDRQLVDRVGAQVALQVECLLREQPATVLPLVEEGLALHLDDAALGAALHVAVRDHAVAGVCLVSHDGRSRAVLPATGSRDTLLRAVVAGIGLADRPSRPGPVGVW
jgi:hypothetical protein